jgi:Zn-dependent peptidase ImmA (M78 family)
VLDISAVPKLSAQALDQLTVRDPTSWSAVMLTAGDVRVVVVNPSHSDGRQSNDLMHECAHVVLNHAPTMAVRAATGVLMVSAYDKQQEAEADWLAAALLLPRAALLSIVQDGVPLEEAASRYRTSLQLLRMRLNQTGVNLQMRRRVA